MNRALSFALFLLLAAALAALPARAQQQGTPSMDQTPPRTNAAAFEPLDLLPPNDYRAGSGDPGEDYWQNAADYEIDVTLDPEQHRITGSETITYTNNSPEDLEYLWVQLDQNLFAPDSRGASITPPNARFSGFFEGGGYELSNVRITRDGATTGVEPLIDDTRMRIALEEALEAEGGTLEISLDFAFTIPPYGADRMGRLDVEQGTVYQLAQWYPRMYVFDDVNGWNALPYLGQGEYYLDYGTFDISITAPREFIVASTGALQNPEEVMTQEQRRRLEEARQSDSTVTIIGRDEVGQPGTRPEGEGPLTWRYRAENVRDAAWAASEAFIWDAARADTRGGEPALAQSVYPREGIGTEGSPGWEQSTQFTKHSIEFYSDFLDEPYPYPVAINVAGIVGGMEYPQIVFCSVRARGEALFGVTDHEFGHEWFPMIVGSDERRHAWMDEGLNTFMGYYSMLDFYGEPTSRTDRISGAYAARGMQQPSIDQPIATFADRIERSSLGFLAYRKPAIGLRILREYILSPELFDSAFQAYVNRWAYKHPHPADFFRTIEDVAGEDLDYFWRGWFYSQNNIDQAITSVETAGDTARVTLTNKTDFPMPVAMRLTFADGSTKEMRVPVEAFFNDRTFTAVVTGGALESVQLDPEGYLPDVQPADNNWTAQGGVGAMSSSPPSESRR